MFAKLVNVECLPVSLEILCLYIQFVSRSLKATKCVLNYVSSLTFCNLLLNFLFHDTSSIQVHLTYKALKWFMCHVLVQASPITPRNLHRLHQLLDLSRPLLEFCPVHVFSFLMLVPISARIPLPSPPRQVG